MNPLFLRSIRAWQIIVMSSYDLPGGFYETLLLAFY